MLRILIVYDDLDPILGSNATLCYQHLAQSVDLKTCQVVVLTGKDCLPEKVEEAITTFEQRPFIFIAILMGNAINLFRLKHPKVMCIP